MNALSLACTCAWYIEHIFLLLLIITKVYIAAIQNFWHLKGEIVSRWENILLLLYSFILNYENTILLFSVRTQKSCSKTLVKKISLEIKISNGKWTRMKYSSYLNILDFSILLATFSRILSKFRYSLLHGIKFSWKLKYGMESSELKWAVCWNLNTCNSKLLFNHVFSTNFCIL